MSSKISHIAIIPDGNRRWAKNKNLPTHTGHLEGSKRVEEIINSLDKIGVSFLTIWASSYDNLTKRSKAEVLILEKIYRDLSKKALEKSKENRQIRFQFIGEWPNLLNKKTVQLLQRVEEDSKDNYKYTVTILIGYNGNREMLSTINKLSKKDVKEIKTEDLKESLWTHNLPPVNLIIRTGNDPHLSNGFMMWLTQNAHIDFSKKMWPEFTTKDLIQSIKRASKIEKRLGA